MKCEINVGASWDAEKEVILNWEKRTLCQNEAVKVYTWATLKSKPKSYLCAEHCVNFERFDGDISDIEVI